MKKWLLSPLNKLYAAIIISTLVFVGIEIITNHYFFLQEHKEESYAELDRISLSLAAQLPYEASKQLAMLASEKALVSSEQVLTINEILQPVVEGIAKSHIKVGIGYYSIKQNYIVAYSPDAHSEKLLSMDPSLYKIAYDTGAVYRGETEDFFLWPGKPAIFSIAPLFYKEDIIGFSFAGMCIDNLYRQAVIRTIYPTAASLLLSGTILIIIIIGFNRLRSELQTVAATIAKGEFGGRKSIFPELEPVLSLIREQSQNMARLERLNLVGEMAAGIGHEVRNPLTTVRGFMQHLSAKQDQKKYSAQFLLMIEEIDRANSIISEFLSLAKNRVVKVETVNINDVIRELQPLIEADALHQNCNIEFRLEGIGLVLIDQKELRQLLLNFLRNAFEAMPKGGTVVLHTLVEGGQAVLSIKDQGTGISDEVLNKLGTPFFTTKENGTGLGLAICYRIAHRHNAMITIVSKVGTGTTVKVIFDKI